MDIFRKQGKLATQTLRNYPTSKNYSHEYIFVKKNRN